MTLQNLAPNPRTYSRVSETNLTKRENYILQFIQDIKEVPRINLSNQGKILSVELGRSQSW
jgi:hypothetical protein